MTKTNHLIRVANLLAAKYAGIDAATIKDRVQESLQTAIANASSAKAGIMPFLTMLKMDQASFSINITRSGDSIAVSSPVLDKPELTTKYAPLSDQIKDYLQKNLEIFPTKINDDLVDYHNLTCTLTYSDKSSQPVATL